GVGRLHAALKSMDAERPLSGTQSRHDQPLLDDRVRFAVHHKPPASPVRRADGLRLEEDGTRVPRLRSISPMLTSHPPRAALHLPARGQPHLGLLVGIEFHDEPAGGELDGVEGYHMAGSSTSSYVRSKMSGLHG